MNNQNINLKKNTLLFGDLLTDYNMLTINQDQNLIAIGFLKPDQRYNFEYFKKKFDIVIMGDGNYMLHHKLLSYICNMNDDIEFRDILYRQPAYKEFL